MKRRCAWCSKVYGHKQPLRDRRTTHGMCPTCKQRLVQKLHAGDKGKTEDAAVAGGEDEERGDDDQTRD
jgi:hypothetical protein